MLTTVETHRLLNRRARCDRTAGAVSCTMIEMLEGRQMMSAAPPTAAFPADLVNPVLAQHKALKHINANDTASVLPLQITSVTVNNGQLLATGKLGGETFTAPLDLSLADAAPAGAASALAAPATPILHLTLGPIHLDLLGLKVDTSKICLNIDAQSGNGNLLGNLLTDVANLLNGGTPLGNILGNLSSTNLNTLLNGITGLLNGVLGQLTAPTSLAGVTTSAPLPPRQPSTYCTCRLGRWTSTCLDLRSISTIATTDRLPLISPPSPARAICWATCSAVFRTAGQQRKPARRSEQFVQCHAFDSGAAVILSVDPSYATYTPSARSRGGRFHWLNIAIVKESSSAEVILALETPPAARQSLYASPSTAAHQSARARRTSDQRRFGFWRRRSHPVCWSDCGGS